MKTIEAWHFCDGSQLRDGQELEVGRTYTHTGNVSMCHSGLHASRRIIDALGYAPGAVCCQVLLWGDVVEGKDKLVARNRLVLSALDITPHLNEFTLGCATAALLLTDVQDQRCWDAIEAKRAWLRGDIDASELSAAWSAAWSAARSAARSAAEYAAWSAAWSAAEYAAWYAARDAAESAAWSAARPTAEYAARSEQNTVLEETIREAILAQTATPIGDDNG